jgi:hypothetical protein
MAAGNPEHDPGVARRRFRRMRQAPHVAALVLAAALTGSIAPSAIARGVGTPIQPLLVQDLGGLAAQVLAQWITEARRAMLGAGTQPVPPQIVQALSGYFPPALLQQVRYRSGGSTEMSLPGLALQYGDAAAITLVDVIMFDREADAQQDLKLWAHELTHVMQYRRWGIDGFAARYIADSRGVEREAYSSADRFIAWRYSQRR